MRFWQNWQRSISGAAGGFTCVSYRCCWYCCMWSQSCVTLEVRRGGDGGTGGGAMMAIGTSCLWGGAATGLTFFMGTVWLGSDPSPQPNTEPRPYARAQHRADSSAQP